MAKTGTKKTDERIRNITFLIYEDSCIPDWKEYLNELHIPMLWIYHDKDVENGKPKKPHYHVMIMFEGKKSDSQLQEIVDRCGGANGQYKKINSIRGMARYLCHMDDPDKYQYDSKEVHAVAVDYSSLVGMASDKYKAIREMLEFIKANDIISYDELMDYAMVHRYDWFKALCDECTMVIKEYLKSRTWKLEHQNRTIKKDLHL